MLDRRQFTLSLAAVSASVAACCGTGGIINYLEYPVELSLIGPNGNKLMSSMWVSQVPGFGEWKFPAEAEVASVHASWGGDSYSLDDVGLKAYIGDVVRVHVA